MFDGAKGFGYITNSAAKKYKEASLINNSVSIALHSQVELLESNKVE